MSARNRVLSFMSNFSSNRDSQRSPTPASSALKQEPPRSEPVKHSSTMPVGTSQYNMDGSAGQPRVQRERAQSGSRPMSMVQTYYPSMMDVSQDTLPELQPIFTFLNSHANKLYQEGYFLKLDDQNTHGRPNADRTWTECFAQLVGTVLSLWDAAELDAAGQDGEVLPKFINLTDASIKMIEALPTRADSEAPLQNVLSISTAGKNRYLLHFNSHHSLIQWTAGIRLAMFEHATLQEAYTGALIAGKGKALNNINIIMDRARMPTADWARVRFGAGTPWRRCWCVVSPPDEKEVQKLQKQLNKKKSAYDRSRPPILRGDIKFYDSKKTKKVRPIATISDAYSAFAIYPQSKPLIDASTLVKVEGSITIHSSPPSTTEGFVFVMPETHAAVTGFEMMLRWLFPVFDTFGLYGRPGRLVADTTDSRSLMFAMPKHRRYGYLEILDVSGLILEPGSATWKEGEWRKRMKELTGKRMTAVESSNQGNSRYSSRRSTRNSFGPSRSRIHFDDGASVRSTPSTAWVPGQTDGAFGIPRTDSAPPGAGSFAPPPPRSQPSGHTRSFSESQGLDRFRDQSPSNYDGGYDNAPTPPPHAIGVAGARDIHSSRYVPEIGSTPERMSSEDEQAARASPVRELQELQATTTPEPVAAPPAFAHGPGALPISKPYHSPELRRANSRMSNATLSQLAGAGGVAGYHAHGEEARDYRQPANGDRGVLPAANLQGVPANHDGLNEGLVAVSKPRFSFEDSSPSRSTNVNTPTSFSQQSSQYPFTSPNLPSPNDSRIDPPQPPPKDREQLPQTRIYEPPKMFDAPVSNIYSGPVGHGHNHQESTDSTYNTASQPRLQTSPSIVRKPLPTRTTSIQTPASADTQSSLGSLGQHFIDQTAFDMIGRDNHTSTRGPAPQLNRQNTDASSVYEDNASTASPDYASTRRSVDTRKSVEKPRAGVMKTVGNPEDPRYTSEQVVSSPPIQIDFGPTLNLASGAQPRSQSQGPSQAYARAASPGPTLNNFTADRPPRHVSPAIRPDSAGHSRSPARKPLTPEKTHYRNNSSESRTVAWQPGMAASGNSGNRMSITPEQFVQQRAAMAPPTPLYAHQRQPSSNTLRANTPPLVNRPSDYMGLHSRNSSADLLQRPSSRGANVVLGPSGTGDMPTSLSAREQEHIAKMTGTPLINMAQNNNRQAPPSGLVGAIEAREREKQHMKQGINSQAVQNAISQRQQQALHQQQQQHYQEQMAGDYRAPQQYNNMGQSQQYPQAQRQQPQQPQNWGTSPAASVFAQGGGWSASTPSPGFAGPEQGRQSPSQYPPRQQQYFPPQQNPQQGRGNGPFHGHGH
ncbi:hypothetical protein VTL71DRAFT_11837 [Oculimacula yallundae]|uniref:PH domain-containing protein n=1 Tax=Oculimacula yallundae TaxID=86028 RepID=A0ABR4CRJ9_9HELO